MRPSCNFAVAKITHQADMVKAGLASLPSPPFGGFVVTARLVLQGFSQNAQNKHAIRHGNPSVIFSFGLGLGKIGLVVMR